MAPVTYGVPEEYLEYAQQTVMIKAVVVNEVCPPAVVSEVRPSAVVNEVHTSAVVNEVRAPAVANEVSAPAVSEGRAPVVRTHSPYNRRELVRNEPAAANPAIAAAEAWPRDGWIGPPDSEEEELIDEVRAEDDTDDEISEDEVDEARRGRDGRPRPTSVHPAKVGRRDVIVRGATYAPLAPEHGSKHGQGRHHTGNNERTPKSAEVAPGMQGTPPCVDNCSAVGHQHGTKSTSMALDDHVHYDGKHAGCIEVCTNVLCSPQHHDRKVPNVDNGNKSCHPVGRRRNPETGTPSETGRCDTCGEYAGPSRNDTGTMDPRACTHCCGLFIGPKAPLPNASKSRRSGHCGGRSGAESHGKERQDSGTAGTVLRVLSGTTPSSSSTRRMGESERITEDNRVHRERVRSSTSPTPCGPSTGTEESPTRRDTGPERVGCTGCGGERILGTRNHEVINSIPRLRREGRSTTSTDGSRRDDSIRPTVGGQSGSIPRPELVGTRPPSLKELGFYATTQTPISARTEKDARPPIFKAKDVSATLNWAALDGLEMDNITRAELMEARPWTIMSPYYEEIEAWMTTNKTREGRQRIAEDHVKTMIEYRKYVKSSGGPRFQCNTFSVSEMKLVENEDSYWQEYLRPIVEPIANDAITALKLPVTVVFDDRKVVRAAAAKARCAIEFDVAACYDQISVEAPLRRFFAVTPTEDLAVLSMGYKPSCKVAQAVVRTLLPPPSILTELRVIAVTRVDNVVFFGDEEGCRKAAEIFKMRCHTCGVILNNESHHDKIVGKVDFLGESFTFLVPTESTTSTTVQNTTKTLVKLKMVAELLATTATMTARRVAAIIGLCVFAAGVVNQTLSEHHFCLRFLAQLEVSAGWDVTISIPWKIHTQLREWVSSLVRHQPVNLTPKEMSEQMEIWVDASEWGWGAVSVLRGTTKYASGRWTDEERLRHRVESSVVAEPLALRKAVARFCTPGANTHVRINTDHLPMVFAWRKGVGKCFAYSEAITFLARFSGTTFEVMFVPGEENPADALSRGGLQPSQSLRHAG
jgi:hypothetical protein